MRILAIDPGTTQSAFVTWLGDKPGFCAISPNQDIKSMLCLCAQTAYDVVAIEMVACMGMPVGKETFETVLWIGRFCERSPREPKLVYRKEIKLHHCNSLRAKDSNIRQALIDRFGTPGTKSNPGLLYGIKSHLWSALALAIYVADTEG